MTFFALRLAGAFAGLVLTGWSAFAEPLPSHKDRLFAYPEVLSSQLEGRYRTVDYQEMRDINGRDEIPERRVKGRYISLGVRRVQQDLAIEMPAGRVRHIAVGKTEGASVITLYLHGQGGSRQQGVDDFSFGGNFNRIKNLMVAAGGLYLSPDFSDFGPGGVGEIAALIAHYAESSPGASLFVACGSAGGALCWELADDSGTATRLSGLLLLGSHWDDGFFDSAAFEQKTPVFFGHGSRDTVFPVERQEAFFRAILERSPDYPARFVRFETGTHGTPIRMTDWRETLNWMLSVKP